MEEYAMEKSTSMSKTEIKEDTKEKIIKEFLPYIKYTAFRMAWKLPRHMTIDDLISVGLMGLMDALDRYEPGRVKLKRYAELRIKGSMIDSLRAAAWIPRSQMKKIKAINSARQRLEGKYGRMPDDTEVANLLKIPLNIYFQTLQYAASSNTVRLNDVRSSKYPGTNLCITECIADQNTKSPLTILEEHDIKRCLTELIDGLSRIKQTILSLYYYEELTMREIGVVLNFTESRVSQIHARALSELKARINGSLRTAGSAHEHTGETSQEYSYVRQPAAAV